MNLQSVLRPLPRHSPPARISVNIFWYFMHMRGKTISEFTVIIEYPVERTDSGRQSRFRPREHLLAWVVDWPSETLIWNSDPQIKDDLIRKSIPHPRNRSAASTFCALIAVQLREPCGDTAPLLRPLLVLHASQTRSNGGTGQ